MGQLQQQHQTCATQIKPSSTQSFLSGLGHIPQLPRDSPTPLQSSKAFSSTQEKNLSEFFLSVYVQ